MTDPVHQISNNNDSESRLAELALHTDPSAFVNEMLQEAETERGDDMYLDGAEDLDLPASPGTDDGITAETIQEDELLNELEEAE